ncbi:unnamed protein product [Didymodactylos carnosus]|uniref:TLC domain-containing protein n=2 Tax=Didymodactylos carnosus TaxID=1234261 RepID=A0A8S2HPK1_9BILA|nr:unnamed protein product [Didymodactylos carnosus]CAF3667078.1 unnamed protein product [Didymodactylos carnosus]
MDLISTTIWNENFWLPKNVTWKDFSTLEEEGVRLPALHDLLYVYPLAGMLYIARLIFEHYIARPFGRSLGLRDVQNSTTQYNQQQQQLSRKKGNKTNVITDNQSNSTYKQQYPTNVIHRKQPSDGRGDSLKSANDNRKPSSLISYHRVPLLAKFSESCWRFVFYLSVFIYGLIVLRNKPWLWDTRQCWLSHPNQPLTKDIFWYYMIELAFYWSLIFSQFIDVKRKSAKMAKYARAQRVCDTLFVIFALVWLVTRLCYFPYKVLYTTTYEEVEILGYFPAFYLFNGLLMLLQVLHYFWFYLICQVAIGALKAGKVEKDERSDSEDSDNEPSDSEDGNDETYTKHDVLPHQQSPDLSTTNNGDLNENLSENSSLQTSNSTDDEEKDD